MHVIEISYRVKRIIETKNNTGPRSLFCENLVRYTIKEDHALLLINGTDSNLMYAFMDYLKPQI